MFSITVVEQIFEGLIECDGNGSPRPLLADWDVSEDGRVYTFHILKGMRFHDGAPLNSAAVKMNFEFLMGLDLEDLRSGIFRGYPYLLDVPAVRLMIFKEIIDSVETPDEYTAVLRLKRPYYLLPELLCSPPFLMVSPKVLEIGKLEYISSHPIGTGPFKFKRFDKFTPKIYIVRNEDYRVERVPKTVEIELVVLDTIRLYYQIF